MSEQSIEVHLERIHGHLEALDKSVARLADEKKLQNGRLGKVEGRVELLEKADIVIVGRISTYQKLIPVLTGLIGALLSFIGSYIIFR